MVTIEIDRFHWNKETNVLSASTKAVFVHGRPSFFAIQGKQKTVVYDYVRTHKLLEFDVFYHEYEPNDATVKVKVHLTV